jgi:hypothetical protein
LATSPTSGGRSVGGYSSLADYGHGVFFSLLLKLLTLSRIFGRKRDEVTVGWGKLHNEELRNSYSSQNTESFSNFVDRFTALRFTATGELLAARRIRFFPMNQ